MIFERTQYDEIAKKYANTDSSIFKRYSSGPTLLKMCGDLSGQRVIDIGCGSGFFTRKIVQQCHPASIIGLDISVEELEIAKAIEGENPLGIKYVAGDIRGVIDSLGLFDMAAALFVINYSQSKEVLQKMSTNIFNMVKPGGSFLTVIPNSDVPTFSDEKYEVLVDMKMPPKEGSYRTVTYLSQGKDLCSFQSYFWFRSTYEQALREAGFQDIKFVDLIVADEGMVKFGEEFWSDHLDSPHGIGVSCRR